MAFWVARRFLTFHPRIAQAHDANGRGRNWQWHMLKNEHDAKPRCAADALNQAVCTGKTDRKCCARY